MRPAPALFALLLAGQAAALDLVLPERAERLSERVVALDDHHLPTGPATLDKAPPMRRFEGRVSRRTWRLAPDEAGTLGLVADLRTQLEAAGFEILYACADTECGGFDFRFALEVVPAPDMYVDIFDFRYLGAASGAEAVGLLASRLGGAVYLEVVEVAGVPRAVEARPAAAPLDPGNLAGELDLRGWVALGDLVFTSGGDRLEPGGFASLDALAAWLGANPARVIALVGHTDSVGTLEQNIALSRRRAEAVRDRLIADHGIDPARLEAEGMGYLAPVGSNLTPEGRAANRRVEAIVLR